MSGISNAHRDPISTDFAPHLVAFDRALRANPAVRSVSVCEDTDEDEDGNWSTTFCNWEVTLINGVGIKIEPENLTTETDDADSEHLDRMEPVWVTVRPHPCTSTYDERDERLTVGALEDLIDEWSGRADLAAINAQLEVEAAQAKAQRVAEARERPEAAWAAAAYTELGEWLETIPRR